MVPEGKFVYEFETFPLKIFIRVKTVLKNWTQQKLEVNFEFFNWYSKSVQFYINLIIIK